MSRPSTSRSRRRRSLRTTTTTRVPRRALRSAIYRASARAGGSPIWLQGDEHEGGFLLQFDKEFASINLGDCGIMYVFTDTQFWQCH